MQAAIDRVMQAFTMMANLTPRRSKPHAKTRAHLAGMVADEKALAVEGLRYLRGPGRVAAAKNGEGSNMTDSLTKRDQPDRSKINMNAGL